MSAIKHPNLKAELLYLIGRASTPLSSAELYERSELADETVQVSKALCNLQSDGKIVRAPGEGRARYTLADGVTAPAPAGKAGRSKAVQADDAAAANAAPLTGIRPAADHFPGARKMVAADPVPLAGAFDAARLADAIIARIKKHFTRPENELEVIPGHTPEIHIHIEQVDIHLGGL